MSLQKTAASLAASVLLFGATGAQAEAPGHGTPAHAHAPAAHAAPTAPRAAAKPKRAPQRLASASPIRYPAASAHPAPAQPAPYKLAPVHAPHGAAAHAPVTPAPVVVTAVRANPAPTQREIAALFEVWNAALQTGNPELVASLYAPDGVLLPTVSNRVRTTREDIAEYFHHFLELQPRGTINQQNIRILGPDLALNAGVYTFDIVRDGRPEQVTARYDFLYKRINGRWMIMDHHSSKMPEPMPGAPVQTAAAH